MADSLFVCVFLIGIAATIFWRQERNRANGFEAQIQALKDKHEGELEAAADKTAMLESLAVTDPLTELYNRRGFMQHATPLVGLALRRGDQRVCAVSVDLDGLKLVNDVYGHDKGDVYIRVFADILRACFVRAGDVVARMGGDEFVIVFLCNDADDAMRALRRLHESIRHRNIDVGWQTIQMRASIGASILTVRPRPRTDPSIPRLAMHVPTNPTMARVLIAGPPKPLEVAGGKGAEGHVIERLIDAHQKLADSYMYAAKKWAKENPKKPPQVILDGVILT